MNVKQYEANRKRLVELIDRGLSLRKGIPDKAALALAEVRRKVFENQFRIVLVSGFECGKSTTFNLLCGGREISPRGLMVPTSATVVSAQNTVDDSLVGKASVVWRSDRELTMIFAKPLLRHFKALDKRRFGDVRQADDLGDLLHFPQDLPLVKKAVKAQVGDILDSRRRGMTDEADLDAVRMAYVIAHFYDDPHIRALKARTDFTVDEVAKLIAFPKQFARDWMKSDVCAYTAEECVFAFVRQVHCHVKSEYLARTGSVLIDCPGLFSSSYDTSVAYEILENADAVWYILNGMGIGEYELKALKQVMAAKPNGIFYTVNLFAATERQARETGVPHTVQCIRQATGRDLKADEFHYYHALLALSALQLRRVQAGALTQHDKDEILRLYEHQHAPMVNGRVYRPNVTPPVETVIRGSLSRALGNAYGIDLATLESAGVDLGEECLHISGVDDVLSAIENEVLARKAKSILIDNGAHKAVELIQSVENELMVTEAVLREEETKRSGDYEAARKKLEDFRAYCDRCLDALRDDTIDHSLAFDYWNDVINSSTDEVAELAAEKIATYDLNELRQGLSEQIVNDTFSEIVKPKATAWANLIKSGYNEQFNKLIGSVMKRIVEETSRQWAVVIQGDPMLQNLPTPKPVAGIEVMNTEIIDRVIASAPGVSTDIVIGSSIGAAIGAFLGSWIFPGIGTYIGGVLGGVAGAIFEGGLSEEQRTQQIREKISEGLRQFVANPKNIEEVVRKQQVRIEELRNEIIGAFDRAFGLPLETLTAQYNAAKGLLEDASVAREQLIRQHQAFREEELMPLRREIEEFEKSVLRDSRMNGGEQNVV